MTRAARVDLLRRISALVDSPVVVYATGDRQGMESQIETAHAEVFQRHLRGIGDVDQLAVLLYTRGGSPSATLPIVNFLREHCRRLVVLAPSHIHSAGTLLAMGADEIVMGRYASLSPIDPTVANGFNPVGPAGTGSPMPIQTEDVMAFLEFAGSDDADEPLGMRRLVKHIHPLALGNVQRSVKRIRRLARNMLRMHDSGRNHPDPEGLIAEMTTLTYSHRHTFSRREAAELGLQVSDAHGELDELLYEFLCELQDDMQLDNAFDPVEIYENALVGPEDDDAPVPVPQRAAPEPVAVDDGVLVDVRIEQAYIETTATCDAMVSRGAVALSGQSPGQSPGRPPARGAAGRRSRPEFRLTSRRWESADTVTAPAGALRRIG